MKLIVLLVLFPGTFIGMVSSRRRIQCRLLQPVVQTETTTLAPPVHIINSTEFEMIMAKLDALDLRLVKTEFALQNTVHTIANEVSNLGQVMEKLAWVAGQTELSSSFVEHHVKLIEYNLTALQKDVRDVLSVQQRLPTRSYIENALVKLRFVPAPAEPMTEEKVQMMVETMQSMMMDEPIYEYCDQLPETSKSGVYIIHPDVDFREPMKVFCNQTFMAGGWTVIQNRFNGTVNFYRDFQEYKRGFGKMDGGEFWLGLDRIHRLTYSAPHELVIVLEDWEGVWKYARYENFEVAGEYENYKINKIDGYYGTAGDSMNYTINGYFTTFDQDHDTNEKENCAVKYHGAWWYKACHSSNLNGKFLRGNTTEFGAGMNWNTFHGMNYALKSSMIMIRRRLDLITLDAHRTHTVFENATIDEGDKVNSVE
ncbi:microfibril-associated glycoprotein 4-like isoform X2 [Wyeomyia smithii]|uniref:microfibril-associated glycoprotein 4-like isoform X2 n=1 Tax=Wyeomyia smithii TaxID=174621 RepID=UPI002467E6FE|nr:microfibril-associated glycoprotein 4-like isoform X2 [Wyeomyia smithii]